MTRDEIFEAWAPPGALWSQWAKPVLFAQLGKTFPQAALQPAPSTAPPAPFGLPPMMPPPVLPDWRTRDVAWEDGSGGAALVLDLPGVESLALGLALTARGYRPVPMFNACLGPHAACDLTGVVLALEAWAADVKSAALPADAPPAFLLDSERLVAKRPLTPGTFDNRWVVFPQDLPSATFLLSRAIRRVVVVQERATEPTHDLAHVLLRWQEAGLRIETYAVGDRAPVRIEVKKPSGYRTLWARILVAMGLRRSAAGGFGAMIPEQSSGGGYS